MTKNNVINNKSNSIANNLSNIGYMPMKIKAWHPEEIIGYKPITTFYQDFSIADAFGIDAIRDTYNRTFRAWKKNYKYLTELVMVLNRKILEHYENNDEYTMLYDSLYRIN